MTRLDLLRFWRDWWLCWKLARDPVERAMSFDPRKPTPWGHTRWMWRQRFGNTTSAWVIRVDGQRIGLIRLEMLEETEAEVHITILPEARGLGIGQQVLHHIGAICVDENVRAVAWVKIGNDASVGAFEKAGFVTVDSTPDRLKMIYAGHLAEGLYEA